MQNYYDDKVSVEQDQLGRSKKDVEPGRAGPTSKREG